LELSSKTSIDAALRESPIARGNKRKREYKKIGEKSEP